MKLQHAVKGLMAASALAGAMAATPALAITYDNATFTQTFGSFEGTVEQFVEVLVNQDWQQAKSLAENILQQSQALKEMAEADDNNLWLFDATNTWHHSEELLEAIDGKDAVEAVYLVGTLTAHIGYIQSNNPLWLREHIRGQIDLIEQGIKNKDQEMTRNAAEITHVSANKIVLSAGLQKDLYKHTRWLTDVRQMNRLGDHIIGAVNSGDWQSPLDDLQQIKLSFNKWDKSFK